MKHKLGLLKQWFTNEYSVSNLKEKILSKTEYLVSTIKWNAWKHTRIIIWQVISEMHNSQESKCCEEAIHQELSTNGR